MRTLLTESQLRDGVAQMAEKINRTYGESSLTVVAVMTGSIILMADLIRSLTMPLRVGIVGASSYRGAVVPGELSTDTKMLLDIRNRDVLLVDDIFDTGSTLQRLCDDVTMLGARSVRTAVLLRKSREHAVSLRPDFIGFEIPDEFVVGYGLDYQDHYRNLPFLAVLEPEEIEQGASHVRGGAS